MKVIAIFALVAAIAIAGATKIDMPQHITSEVAEDLFGEFVKLEAKDYRSEVEQQYRLKVFTDNLHFIAKHNKEAAKGMHSYTLGIGPFADLTLEEFTEQYLMKDFQENQVNEDDDDIPHQLNEDDDDIPHDDNDDDDDDNSPQAPTSIDWRTKKCVGAVRNQKSCGSCWAFAAAALIEGAYAQKTGKLVDVSEQQMVDCDKVSHGCNGGWTDAALRSVISKGGINSESTYPYCACSGSSRSCKFDKNKVVAKISSVTTVASGTPNENAILNAVATRCGVSVYINASSSQFQHYSSGVFDYSGCSTSINHAVAVVGYGTASGKPYWIVRNSWSAGWGNKGYINIVRNKNMCGIGKYSYYANV